MRKNFSTRFWDAKHSGYQVQGYGDNSCHHTPCGMLCEVGSSWVACAFFVSVKVPLVELEGSDGDGFD